MTSVESETARRVFLSYARSDQALAEHVAHALTQSGANVWTGTQEILPGESFETQLRENIRTNDVVVVLLTPATAESRWFSTEVEGALSRDLERRGAELIPVLAAPTRLPPLLRPLLRNQAMVDLTEDLDAGVRRLVEQVQATSQVDFSAMSPQAFENLVADLLQAVGFALTDVRQRRDQGVDLRASYQRTDPFGMPETEMWLVETKLYSHHRVSIDAIRQLAGYIAMAPSGTRGLLVTNAQLTSVAQEYVAELEQKPQVRLRVLDGVELKRLLRQFPAVTARHFSSEMGHDGDS